MVATDINNDGRMDLFVANDTVANFLFVNRGKESFEEIGDSGREWPTAPRAGRDPAWAWILPTIDQDGWMDLFVANIDQEIYSLYRNNHDETFDDHGAGPTGIGMPRD